MEGVRGLSLWLPLLLLLPFCTCLLTAALVDDHIPWFREAPVFRNGRSCPVNPNSPLPSVDDQNNDAVFCDAASAHVAMTLERGYLRGTMAAVLSVVQHAECPENVVFHFLACDRDASRLQERLLTAFPYLRFRVYTFDTARVEERISPSIRQALDHPLNYARAYIPEILPTCLHRIVYLDSDILVFDDIAKLWGTELNNRALAAPEYCHTDFSTYFSRGFWFEESLAKVFSGRRPCYFNTGVMVMDLEKWRTEAYAREMEAWMEIQKRMRIYELGSLPPFLLVFAGRVEPVAHRWNQHGLGGDNRQGRCRALHPGPVSLLHWSGKGKPWQRLDDRQPCPLDTLWASYDLLVTPE